ncbi:hypothetical protein B0H10DRAFT_2218150 [Mycena sp. CBHHK59/15]|nr:hypothetical protein B0H10DRAFT_2218150 [Mycena sp. CBHHK59/15]
MLASTLQLGFSSNPPDFKRPYVQQLISLAARLLAAANILCGFATNSLLAMATAKPRIRRTPARPVDGGLNCVLLTHLALDTCLIVTAKSGFLSKKNERHEPLTSRETAAFVDPGSCYHYSEADADEVYGVCASFTD